jgi:hypothetical protein
MARGKVAAAAALLKRCGHRDPGVGESGDALLASRRRL